MLFIFLAFHCYTQRHQDNFMMFCICILRSSCCNLFLACLHNNCTRIGPQACGTAMKCVNKTLELT